MRPEEKVDLTNCDREPIHLLGNIQPCGYMLVSDLPGWKISHVSANAGEVFGIPSQALIGQASPDVLGREIHHQIANRLSMSTGPEAIQRLFELPLGPDGRRFDASLHVHDSKAFIELEPSTSESGDHTAPLDIAKTMITRLIRTKSSSQFFDRGAQLVHGLTGFDRVMIYRFAPDGSGEVVAESVASGVDSFLGLHYPASDIPKQARELYRKNWIRMIRSVNDVPVPIIRGGDAAAEPLDLSYGTLRSVSPIHVEYLRNMGVEASLSISILHTGELWGLIACHHYSPLLLPLVTRTTAEIFGLFFSLQLESMERAEEFAARKKAEEIQSRFLPAIPSSKSLFDALREHAPSLCELLECDGFGIWISGQWHGEGELPPLEEVPALMDFLTSVSRGKVWSTNVLSQAFDRADAYRGETSGLMAIPLSQDSGDFLVFTRKEIIRTVNWGGNPEKPVSTGPLGDRLTPRKSFEIWKQEVKGQSKPWTKFDLSIAETFHITLMEVALRQTEVVDRHRKEAADRQAVLIAELNHRVKNLLALTRSIVKQTKESSGSLESFATNLEGRITALAFAHDHLHSSTHAVASLRILVKAELAPYTDIDGERGIVDGPPVLLDKRAYPSAALVLHELATNSAKHGSLSVPEGRLEVVWKLEEDGSCRIDWIESRGPRVTPPEKEGFGGRLIRETIPFDLGGKTDVQYAEKGLRALIVIPARNIQSAEQEAEETIERDRGDASLEGLRILLAEDNLVVALDTESRLRELGAANVDLVSSVSHAMKVIGNGEIDVAMLDINLGSGDSIPIAEELERDAIPFIFATGYADLFEIPKKFQEVPILRKPFSDRHLETALHSVLKD